MKTKDVNIADALTLPNFISGNLRLLRKRQGWSQAELAEKVSLNRGNIASYESGTAEPSICKLLRISRLFEVNPRDFTRRDFMQPGELDLARQARHENISKEREALALFRDRSLEFSELINSSHNLFEYKRKNITKPCAEADILAMQYQQLYEVSQQLLQEHRDLLTKAGCQCGE